MLPRQQLHHLELGRSRPEFPDDTETETFIYFFRSEIERCHRKPQQGRAGDPNRFRSDIRDEAFSFASSGMLRVHAQTDVDRSAAFSVIAKPSPGGNLGL